MIDSPSLHGTKPTCFAGWSDRNTPPSHDVHSRAPLLEYATACTSECTPTPTTVKGVGWPNVSVPALSATSPTTIAPSRSAVPSGMVASSAFTGT
jgi:hypothetical protein